MAFVVRAGARRRVGFSQTLSIRCEGRRQANNDELRARKSRQLVLAKHAMSRRETLQASILCTCSSLPDLAIADELEADSAAPLPWAKRDNRRFLHTVMVVEDLPAMEKFLCDVLGMSKLRFRNFPDGSANSFAGYLAEDSGFSLELVAKAATPDVQIGTGFRHYSVEVPNMEGSLMRAMNAGHRIVEGAGWEAGEVFVRDPSGYLWETRPRMLDTTEPFRELSLLVSDIDISKAFYEDVLGMDVVGTEEGKDFKRVFFVWGSRKTNMQLALTQLRGDGISIDKGSDAYVQMACATDDVYQTEAAMREAGADVVRAAGPVPGIGTKVMKVADPDGWVLAFVDNSDFIGELCAAGTVNSDVCSPPVDDVPDA